MRLFFAAWPPPQAAAALQAWAESLACGKVIVRENIHLTLAFLGESEPGRAVAAARRVRARRHDLPIEEARFWKKSGIVWAGPREMPGELERLVKALHIELDREEFILERRPFAAHVTLLRKASAPGGFPPLPDIVWPVHEFLLVSSRTSSQGPSYHPMERFPL